VADQATAPQACLGQNDEGRPCGVRNNLSADGFCIWHDPQRAAQAMEARRRGRRHQGKRGGRTVTVLAAELPFPLETVQDCARWSRWITEKVLIGDLSPEVANRAITAVKELRLSLTVADGIEKRLKAIEQRLAERKTA
jgi:hypothetical protein